MTPATVQRVGGLLLVVIGVNPFGASPFVVSAETLAAMRNGSTFAGASRRTHSWLGKRTRLAPRP